MPLFNTAAFAPIPNEMLFDDVLISTRLLRDALAATACADVTPTDTFVGAEPVNGVFVFTVPEIVAEEPMPGFWLILVRL